MSAFLELGEAAGIAPHDGAERADRLHFNIGSYLPRAAELWGNRAAAVVMGRARGRRERGTVTFAELEALSNRFANGLAQAGIGRGCRTLLMVRPGVDFVALVFALFKLGAVPVMIDPGMGVRRMLECLRRVDVEGFIGVPAAQVMRCLRRGAFSSARSVVTVGRRWLWGGVTLRQIERGGGERFETAATRRDETAAILFTSGATGPAKGVVYEHGMFDAQVRAIQSCYGIEAGEVDLPTFPLFALFSVAMGMTSVIPEMDPSRPARVDPARIVQAVHDYQVTNTFGSPALWKRVASYCVDRGIRLGSLRRVLIAGAPVPDWLIEQLHRVLGSGADVHTPYGATEALPVASIGGRAVLSDCWPRSRSGAGICVGRPLPEIDLRVIGVSDEPIERWSDVLVVGDGEIGEIVVAGPVVTKAYYGLSEATRGAKIYDGDRVWHRMGDVGYRDDKGRVWYCGRKAHRVVTGAGTLYSVCCEAIFNRHAEVSRSALVGVGPRGRQRPVMIVEPKGERFPRGSRAGELHEALVHLAETNEETRSIRDVLFHRSLPVDVRHNAKIDREKLARWAAERMT